MFELLGRVREPLVHVYDGPNRKNVDLAAVLRAAVRGSADSSASVRGAQVGGLVEAQVPFRVRMAPELWLGLASYELTVPGFRVVHVRQFLSLQQTADSAQELEEDEAMFVPEEVHVYEEGPRPVWLDLDAVWRGLVGESGPERPASVRGLSMDGLVVAEVPVAVRMTPTLWLGLACYTLPVYGVREIAVQHFVSNAYTRKRQPGEVEPPF